MPWHELPHGGWAWERPGADPPTELLPTVPPLPHRAPGATELPPKPEPERPTVDDPVLTQPAPLPLLAPPPAAVRYENLDVRSPMFGKAFWLGAVERAGKSAAQCLIGLWAGDVAFNIVQADWQHSLALAGGAAVLSVLTSIVSAGVGPTGSPSLVDDQPGRHALDGQPRPGQDEELPARRLFDPDRDRT